MPGLAPTFCPGFPEDFLRQVRIEVRQKTASHQLVQGDQLALSLHEDRRLGREVAGQCVGLAGRQVQRWRRPWAAGDFSVADAADRGHKAHFPPLDQLLVKAGACELAAETTPPLSEGHAETVLNSRDGPERAHDGPSAERNNTPAPRCQGTFPSDPPPDTLGARLCPRPILNFHLPAQRSTCFGIDPPLVSRSHRAEWSPRVSCYSCSRFALFS